MKDPREKAIQKLADTEGLDRQEAEELVDAILQNADFSQLPPEHQGEMGIDENVQDVQYAPQEDEKVMMEDELLDQEMIADNALLNNDQQGYRQAMARYNEILANLNQKRQKEALDYQQNQQNAQPQPNAQPSAPQEDEELLNRALQKYPQEDEGVVSEAVMKSTQQMTDPATNVNSVDEAEKLLDFYMARGDQRGTYAAVRNLKSPLVCPGCNSKVSRKKDNPMRFVCKQGHVSDLNLEKVAMGGEYDPFSSNEDPANHDYLSPSPGGDSLMNPEMDAPAEPGPDTPSALDQDQKNRLNGALYEAQSEAVTPLNVLGVADGFFETTLFQQLAISGDEIAEYQAGQKRGRAAKGGTTNTPF